MLQREPQLQIEINSTDMTKVFFTLELLPLPFPLSLDNNILMMSLSNFTAAFYMHCSQLQL
jgi:hypothetical protein